MRTASAKVAFSASSELQLFHLSALFTAESHWWIVAGSVRGLGLWLCADEATSRPVMWLLIRKWTEFWMERAEEEVWLLSTSRPLMKTDVRTQCPA